MSRSLSLFLFLVLSSYSVVAAEPLPMAGLRLPGFFSDHMVLQRDMEVPVWGWAEAGETVTVSVADQTVSTKAGADGKWKLTLKALKEADSLVFTVKGATQTLVISDVAVGEVWVGSGQSNMLAGLAKDEADAAKPDKGVRIFRPSKSFHDVDRAEDIEGKWVVFTDRKELASFPGVPYFFARDVRARTGVPIGILLSERPGSRISQWVDPERLGDHPPLAAMAKREEAAREAYRGLRKAYFEKEAQAAATRPGGQMPVDSNAPKPQNLRGLLYNGKIAPLQPYAIRGVIWYQGEDDVGNKDYEALFTALIGGWRKAWGQGDFPFLFVQIAPDSGNDPYIRDVQRRVWQNVKNTAMAVIVDGEVNRHPRHKEKPGTRLALAARALVYGERVEYSGPLYAGMKVAGAEAVITFTHVGGGLVARDGELVGFALAGEDRKFAPAQGKIVGDTIMLTSAAVSKPVAVRYGWDPIPQTNLFNKEGLPASPFRSDDWEIDKVAKP